ncbi:MAG: pyrroline-5-carboxylate reductase [Anaerolineae bacterium]|jgi:pyrroline-5-carboxylate reductase|nr:pyrroline-5-carboxylate reductase [Chloroflexota bacterium]
MTGTLEHARLTLIGGGVMGEAILRGVLNKGTVAPAQVTVAEPVAARREALQQTLGVHCTDDNAQAVQGADVVVFAVKPQVLGNVLAGLRGRVAAHTLVISIVAGAPMALYREAFATEAVVRVIPNTPGQIGQGISLWVTAPGVTELQCDQARELLSALGEEVRGHNENDVDIATAISGSGPAYVFLFIEALTDAGVQLGLTRDVASALALQTVQGSAAYARAAQEHPAVLRNRVTSPGGTTAAALYELEAGGMRAMLTRAAVAAYEQARRLGGN